MIYAIGMDPIYIPALGNREIICVTVASFSWGNLYNSNQGKLTFGVHHIILQIMVCGSAASPAVENQKQVHFKECRCR